jgi:hypothetical protein
MTIATQVNKVLYEGTGETVYPYTFKIFKQTDLVVIRRAVDSLETTLILNTDYEVSGVGADNGGNVTLVGTQARKPPTTGEKLLIKRVVPLTQSTDWVENDNFPAQVIEDAVDRVVCITQQLQEQVDRTLKVAPTSALGGVADPDQIAANAAQATASAAAAAASAASISIGTPGGVATLDETGNVPESQLKNAKSTGSTVFLAQNCNAL